MAFNVNHLCKAIGSCRKGATAVEVALVFPLLAMALFGMLHLGVFFLGTHNAQRSVESIAREVRLLDMPTKDKIIEMIEASGVAPIAGEYKPVVILIDQHGGTFADIRINYSYSMPIPFVSGNTFQSEAGTRVLLRNLS